jgi:hypothetical protein
LIAKICLQSKTKYGEIMIWQVQRIMEEMFKKIILKEESSKELWVLILIKKNGGILKSCYYGKDVTQWQNHGLTCARPWILAPAPQEKEVCFEMLKCMYLKSELNMVHRIPCERTRVIALKFQADRLLLSTKNVFA